MKINLIFHITVVLINSYIISFQINNRMFNLYVFYLSFIYQLNKYCSTCQFRILLKTLFS